MSVRDTNTKRVNVSREVRVPLQTGAIPSTASASKYPMNISDVIINNPNDYLGATAYPFYPLLSLSQDYKLEITGDWNYKLKTGDPIEIKRGNIRNFYTVQNAVFDSTSNSTLVTLFSARESAFSLDSFIGASGYPQPSSDTLLLLNKRIENPNNRENLVKSFDYRMNPATEDFLTLNVSWEIDPKVKVTKIRWRSVPRNENISNVSYTVTTQGLYSQIPTAVINSDTGRSAEIRLTGATAGLNILVTGVTVVQQGGNYLTPPSVVIDSTYLVGLTAAAVTASLNLANKGRIDYIRVLDGGSGYTGASVSVSGSTLSDNAVATAIISDGSIKNIIVTYPGHSYVGATVSITPTGTGGTGASAKANIDLYSDWVYEENMFAEKKKTISGFKVNVPYEIQIIASTDEYFRGLLHYSDSYYFQYSKK